MKQIVLVTILGKKGVSRWGWSSWGHHTRVDGISFLPRVLPLNVLLGVEHVGVEGQGGPLAFLLPLWTFTRPVSDFDQVCSIPHSYHVSFSQSRINVEKCAFSFLTQDQCLRQFSYLIGVCWDTCAVAPSAPHLRSSFSVVL